MPRRSFRLAIVAFVLIASAHQIWAGPLFAPGRRLYVIKTEHFDFIFSEQSKQSALYLSAIAEDLLSDLQRELGLGLHGRVPVVITPDIGTFNGYASPIPYPLIALFDTALPIEWTAFSDNLRALFLHELTHVVSLGSRAPWADFLSGIFGSWVAPALINAPLFMIEGVTVGLEGEGGPGGRADDPLVKERIRQDIRENRFKSPLECTGVYEDFPGGNLYYEYGGLFTSYLRGRYGQEAYARLWKAMGDLTISFSTDPYRVGFYKAFETTYGIPFERAWSDFRDAMSISGIVDEGERVGPSEYQYITSLVAGGGSLFWVDGISGRALRMDCASGQVETLFAADASCEITDASPDGSKILVYRSIALPDGRDRVESIVFDCRARRFDSKTVVQGLREARFFRDGYLGVALNLHNSDLVFVRGDQRKLLLPGSERIMYASPVVLDDRRVALIVSIGARRSIGILDFDSGRLDLVRPEGENSQLFDYVRQISVSGGRILFNHNSDDRMYKLGVLDLSTAADGSIRIDGTDRSGGIFWPVECGDIYYAGRFSRGFGLCRFPRNEADFIEDRSAGEKIPYHLEPFDPASALDERSSKLAERAAAVTVSPYRPLDYFRPFSCWIPYVDLETIDRSFRPMALFLLEDPLNENIVQVTTGYDSAYPFADFTFSWINATLPVLFNLSLEDTLSYASSGPPERHSSASLSMSLSIPLFPSPRSAVFGAGATVFARARGPSDSPYLWPYDGWGSAFSAWAGLDLRKTSSWNGRMDGLKLMSYHDLAPGIAAYKTEANLVYSLRRPALGLDLWAAWANMNILRLDATSPVFSSDRRPEYVEYAALDLEAEDWAVQGSTSWRIVDQTVNSEFLGLYLNRLLLDTGYRAEYFGGAYLDSVFARLSLDVSTPLGAFGGIGMRLFGEVFMRLDGSPPENALGWRLGGNLRTGDPMVTGRKAFDSSW
jgi:hypothetical protein